MGIHLISLQSCSTWPGIPLKTRLLVLLQIACTCIMRKMSVPELGKHFGLLFENASFGGFKLFIFSHPSAS